MTQRCLQLSSIKLNSCESKDSGIQLICNKLKNLTEFSLRKLLKNWDSNNILSIVIIEKFVQTYPRLKYLDLSIYLIKKIGVKLTI